MRSPQNSNYFYESVASGKKNFLYKCTSTSTPIFIETIFFLFLHDFLFHEREPTGKNKPQILKRSFLKSFCQACFPKICTSEVICNPNFTHKDMAV